tara:strand:+ start:407 stop:673 length:267 start_codon:yes stop_codon:yes gene_type:complete
MKDIAIHFFNGIDEKVIPQIKHTNSKHEKAGQAFFRFDNPKALLSDNLKELLHLINEKGQITTREINIVVLKENGKYTAIESVYCWRS